MNALAHTDIEPRTDVSVPDAGGSLRSGRSARVRGVLRKSSELYAKLATNNPMK